MSNLTSTHENREGGYVIVSNPNLLPSGGGKTAGKGKTRIGNHSNIEKDRKLALLKVESGTVTRHVGSRGAFVIEEQVTLPDGRSFPKSFTVWHEGEPPAVGAIVSVIGKFSSKTREYPAPSGMRTAVDISINEPEVTTLHAVAQPTKEELPF